MTLEDLAMLVRRAFPDSQPPKPLDALLGLFRVRSEESSLAELRPTLRARVEALQAASDPISEAFQVDLASLSPKAASRAKRGELMLGQLLLGKLGEEAFEAIYHSRLGNSEFSLRDFRQSRNDTDYRVFDGSGRPLFRINSKFHGSLFRMAKEQVSLEPEDCFPLATYKIWSATQKEQQEHLPYLFLVVSTPITAESVAQALPESVRTLARLVHASEVPEKKRTIEERLVDAVRTSTGPLSDQIAAWRQQLAESTWRVISAQRADMLLRSLLFERAYALRTRNFNQAFRNAEIDMHYSLSADMTPLETVLEILANEGSQGVVGRAIKGWI